MFLNALRNRRLLFLLVAMCCLQTKFTKADEGEKERPSPPPLLGIELDVELSSLYYFRGDNVFMESSVRDQHAVFAPTVMVPVSGTGLWFMYSGYYQINGGNAAYNIDSGRGHEQNLFLAWYRQIVPDRFAIATYLGYYFYPFASEGIVGVKNPSILEPSVKGIFSLNKYWDIGIKGAYYLPLQEAIFDRRYLYVQGYVQTAIPYTEAVALDLRLRAGYKLAWGWHAILKDLFDSVFDMELPVEIDDHLVLAPGLHAAITTVDNRTIEDHYMIWFSFAVRAGI